MSQIDLLTLTAADGSGYTEHIYRIRFLAERLHDPAVTSEFHSPRSPAHFYIASTGPNLEQRRRQVGLRQGAQADVGSGKPWIDLDHIVVALIGRVAQDQVDANVTAQTRY